MTLSAEILQTSLADPQFYITGKIDILLGAEVYCKILQDGFIKGTPEHPIAQKTTLGWILSGQIKSYPKSQKERSFTVVSLHNKLNEDDLLRRFWKLESEPFIVSKKTLTPEEQECEEIFYSTYKRTESGRYIVKLPFRDVDPVCKYGNSRALAAKRLYSLERRLRKDSYLKNQYVDVINEYLNMGHMEAVPENEKNNEVAVYLPHHAVVREDKLTTKVRVVFDASCVSLNNDFLIGPSLQPDLRHLIMRWRLHPIALVADIVKMYRQVQVFPGDADFQRILWRNPDEPDIEVQHLRLLRVTFGTSCAPYLAVKAMQQVAYDEGSDYPMAADRVLKDFYMDDLLTGCEGVAEGLQIYEEMNLLLNKQIRCYANKPDEEKSIIDAGTESVIKILGVSWNRRSETFGYSVKLPALDYPVTKRKVISDIARLYDPLGWIAPTIITAKIFIQKLWLSGMQWDEELPQQLLWLMG